MYGLSIGTFYIWPWPILKVKVMHIWSEYLGNDDRYGTNYYCHWIASRVWAVDWDIYIWHWQILKNKVKVMHVWTVSILEMVIDRVKLLLPSNSKLGIDRFIINNHLYADNSQLLAHMKINAVTEHRRWLETCVKSLQDWWSSRRLQLKPDKTELIWFGSRANLMKLRQLDVMSVNLCSVAVEPVDSVRDLGVILDSELSMQVHLSKISSSCFFHLRRLRKLRPLIDTASAQRLVSAFILSRVDYCHAVLAGLPTSTLAPLQQVLNAAAHFVAGVISCTHVSGIMKSLHWLPIAYRICIKLCVLMHCLYNGTSPSYLMDTTTPISSLPGHNQLRSAMTIEYTTSLAPGQNLETELSLLLDQASWTLFLRI